MWTGRASSAEADAFVADGVESDSFDGAEIEPGLTGSGTARAGSTAGSEGGWATEADAVAAFFLGGEALLTFFFGAADSAAAGSATDFASAAFCFGALSKG